MRVNAVFPSSTSHDCDFNIHGGLTILDARRPMETRWLLLFNLEPGCQSLRSLMFRWRVEARGEFREISVTVAQAATVKGCYLFHTRTARLEAGGEAGWRNVKHSQCCISIGGGSIQGLQRSSMLVFQLLLFIYFWLKLSQIFNVILKTRRSQRSPSTG